MKLIHRLTLLATLGTLLLPSALLAFSSGSTGANGTLDVRVENSATAIYVNGQNVGPVLALPENGVFNFTTVNVQTGATLTFARNAQNTPVTILASGDVVVAGTIDVSGKNGSYIVPGDGGPGGFDGGVGAGAGQVGRRGEGPGGGLGGNPFSANTSYGAGGGGGSFATSGATGYSNGTSVLGGVGGVTYGNDWLHPLLGGSGGGGGGGCGTALVGGAGGGGGGAILIASSNAIDISTGTIVANGGKGAMGGPNYGGGGGGGAGGSVRLIANSIKGAGNLKAIGGIAGNGGFDTANGKGGDGGKGYVRLEGNVTYSGTSTPSFIMSYPFLVNPPNMPSLRIISIGLGLDNVPVPPVPGGDFGAPDVILPYTTRNPVPVVVEGTNIPVDPVTLVTVTSNPAVGSSSTSNPVALDGTLTSSSATVTLNISTAYPSVLTASVTYQYQASNGGPIFIDGERVELVRVATTLGGASQVTYITEHGREIPATL